MNEVMLSGDNYTLVYNALSFGTAVMFGAFVYFLTQINSVKKEYRSGVAVSAIVVGIAGYHYFRIWSDFGDRTMNEGYRYADWLITVPLLIIELLIVLGVSNEIRKGLMWKLVPASAVMIGLGYPGEVSTDNGTKWLFWVLAMIPFVYILWVLYGQLQAASSRESERLRVQLRTQPILLLTWLSTRSYSSQCSMRVQKPRGASTGWLHICRHHCEGLRFDDPWHCEGTFRGRVLTTSSPWRQDVAVKAGLGPGSFD